MSTILDRILETKRAEVAERRAARLIGAGMVGGIEIGADQALGRACLLDLGDQSIPGGGRRIERGAVWSCCIAFRSASETLAFAAAISSRL
jgi:hypothetical protein